MNILIAIDDTDNKESRGTGKLAALLAAVIEENGWGRCRPITRHQMLVHPDIPYTSHNSAMCFAADVAAGHLGAITEFAQAFLPRESAPGSDPGLCIVNAEDLEDREALMTFGKRAKTSVLKKEEAYVLAGRLNVHLSEHGGTGLGVIGALAGTGLRMTGNDGRLRGHFGVVAEDGCLSVADLIRQTGVDVVKGLGGQPLRSDDIVWIGEKVKAVMQKGKSALLVFGEPDGASGKTRWKTCTKEQLRIF